MIAYDRLSLIIPADQALANKALQAAFQQINGISFSNLSDFSGAVKELNTTVGLPYVESLTQALPDSIYQFYLNTFSANYGTGPNGTITIADVLGAVAGLPYTDEYVTIVENINKLYNAGQLTALISIYDTMLNTVDGVYGSGPINIPSGPAAGNYPDYDTAFSGNTPPTPGIGLIPAAQAQIASIVSLNQTITTALNNASNIIGAALVREPVNQTRANIDWTSIIANSQVSLLSFITSISTYGLDTTQGGATQMLENMANRSILGGQALIAALRESRNVAALGNANIETATQVSSDPATPPPTAPLATGTYSESQAQQKLVF